MALVEQWGVIRDRKAAIDMDGHSYRYAELAELGAQFLPSDATAQRRLILLAADNSVNALAVYLRALLTDSAVLLCNPDDSSLVDRFSEIYHPDIVAGPAANGFEARAVNGAAREFPLDPDLALLLSTSGSTGSPKLVRLSRENIWANARSIADYLAITPDDRALCSLPMHYAYGLSIINSHFLAGATVLLNRHSIIEPAFWQFARTHGATSFAGVPHSYDLLDHVGLKENAPPTLRYYTQAGGRLAPASVRKYAELARDNGWQFFVMYGQTEATARMAYLPPHLTLERPEAIGVPIPQGTFLLRDPEGRTIEDVGVTGELVYRGPNVMMGYALCAKDLSQPASVEELPTGDLAMQLDNGLYQITGRLSRFVKIFGKRIGLDDVERILADEGFDAIATGIDDKLLVLCRGGRGADVAVLLQDRLALPPAYFEVGDVEDYPVLPSGKIDYRSLKEGLEKAWTEQARNDSEGSAQSVEEVFVAAFGERARDKAQSFASLGGDSLNYVVTALVIEDRLGALPPSWETLSIGALSELAERRGVGEPEAPSAAPSRFRAIANFDTLRGLACVLVVAYHVVGLDGQAGLRLPDGSPWRMAVDALDFVRMPLFIAMAGYLYALMPQTGTGYWDFLARKARTLLIPGLFVGLFMFAVRALVYHDRDSLWGAVTGGYLHLWFVYALTVVFAIVGLLDRTVKPGTIGWIASIALAAVSLPYLPYISLFSFNRAIHSLQFFAFGILLCHNPAWLQDRLFLTASTALVIVFALISLFAPEAVDPASLRGIRLLASLGIIACLFRWMPRMHWLAAISPFTFAIYLWHPFANAAVRAALLRLHVTQVPILFTIGLCAGVLLPILLFKTVERHPKLSLPLVGR